jgi:hypothetical protein
VSFVLTLRYSGPRGARVEHERFEELAPALDELERRVDGLAGDARRRPVDLGVRQFEPVQQVAARVEVAGPGRFRPRVAGGVDVRGDGSTEAFTGRVRRQVVDQRDGETPVAALRRALLGVEDER